VTTLVDTASRLRRLLAILAWLAQVGEAPIDEVAERFDLTPEALVTELEMAACCGVPPYTPDQLMEIVVTEATVSTRVGIALTRPRRLSPPEGFALAASARALLAVPGSDEGGALSRALDKLDRALGGEQIGVELDAPALLEVVGEALASGGRLAISYYSASSDRVTEREIDPIRLFASEGHWYVDAWCTLAGDVRRFRVDRINAARPVDVPARPDGSGSGSGVADGSGSGAGSGVADGAGSGVADGAGSGVADGMADSDTVPATHRDLASVGPAGFDPFVPGPDSRRVRLSVDPSTAWLVESIPSAGPPESVDGRVELEVFVAGDAWLERLLLRLGPDARVIFPEEYRSLGAEAAARVLERYR
jgi:proteasome accessory factor C